MNRVKDYISFAIWFVGLSYVALWPMVVPDSIAAWLAPQARIPACGGLLIAPLQELCVAHSVVALSPGLHLIGTMAAFWVTARLVLLVLLLSLRRLLPVLSPASPHDALSRARLGLRQILTPLIGRRRSRPSPPRYVAARREFGMRGRSR